MGEEEIRAVTEALRRGQVGGNGPICQRVERQLTRLTGAAHVLLTPNATQAIEIFLAALGIGAGDEVLMPSFAFVTLATSVCARGARPVFCDLNPETLNLDPVDVERRLTPRSRLVVPVHYAGVSCDLDRLAGLAETHGIKMLEDAAQALMSTWRGRSLGTLGDAGILSFHATKNATCGEGGALLTNDPALFRAAEIIREKGTDRSAFLRGEVDKYTWRGPGGNYVMSDLLAALLEVQLDRLGELQAERRKLWNIYHDGLADCEAREWIRRPVIPAGTTHNHHLYPIRTRTPDLQQRLLHGLKEAGIGATFHFQPLHDSPYARNVLNLREGLPHTEHAAATLLRLPLYQGLTEAEALHVVAVTRDLLRRG